jgi:phage shock protein A
MGLFKRTQTWFSAQVNHLLDQAEDPNMTLDYSYEKQLEQLQQIRRSVADVATQEARLRMQEAQVQAQYARLQDQAKQALSAGREDLARMALERGQALTAQLQQIQGLMEALARQHEQLVGAEQRLSARVETFRTQKEMVKAQYQAAQSQVRITEAATGLSEEMADVNLAMQRAQDKILNTQARADALDSMLASGEISEQLVGPTDNIQMQLDKVSIASQVEQQLAAMHQELGLPAPQQAQSDIPQTDQAGQGNA